MRPSSQDGMSFQSLILLLSPSAAWSVKTCKGEGVRASWVIPLHILVVVAELLLNALLVSELCLLDALFWFSLGSAVGQSLS